MKCFVRRFLLFLGLFFVGCSYAMEHKAEGSGTQGLHRRAGRTRAHARISVEDIVSPLLKDYRYPDVMEIVTDAIRERRYDDCVTILVFLTLNRFFIEPSITVYRDQKTKIERPLIILTLKLKDLPTEILAQGWIMSSKSYESVTMSTIAVLGKTYDRLTQVLRFLTEKNKESESERALRNCKPESMLGCGTFGHFAIQ